MAKNEKKAPRKAVKGMTLKAVSKRKPGKGVPAKPLAIQHESPPRVATSTLPAASAAVLDRLFDVVVSRRNADPMVSHSARLLSRGTAKIAQKFGEEAVECLIEAVGGDGAALVGESADVLYHLIVMWVDAGIRPDAVWNELQRREGISGIAEKAGRARKLSAAMGVSSTKIP